MISELENHINQESVSTPIRYDSTRDIWIISGLAEARAILRSNEDFSLEVYREIERDSVKAQQFMLSSHNDHWRYRRAIASAFSIQQVTLLEEYLMRPVAHAVAALLPAKGKVDSLKTCVLPYQSTVIYTIAGVDKMYGDEIVAILRAVRKLADEGLEEAYKLALAHLHRRATEIFINKPFKTAFGLLTYFQDFDAGGLSPDEISMMFLPFFQTLAARLDRDLPSALLENVAQADSALQDRLRKDTKLLLSAADETVRLQHWGIIPRVARRARTFNGVTIPEGSKVIIMLGHVGRDLNYFSDSDTFRPGRKNLYQHVGFGIGCHRCPGIHFARSMAVCLSEAILSRFRSVALARKDGQTYLRLDVDNYD